MTIQPVETGTTLDLELIVGEMPAIPCEIKGHAKGKYGHDAGPASRYIRAICPNCGHDHGVQPACATYITAITRSPAIWCGPCGSWQDSKEMVTILGPANSL
jgi:ribosomal protein S27E